MIMLLSKVPAFEGQIEWSASLRKTGLRTNQ
jgi:hypothetical protein